jgi:sarcosine oxidase gamma subunit
MERVSGREGVAGPLDDLLLYAGASMARDGSASHYGSAFGEIAVCLRAVGLADRHELRTFELRGSARALDEATSLVTGRQPPVGIAVRGAQAWWFRVSEHRLLLLCEPDVHRDLAARLDRLCSARAGRSWIEVSDDYEALGLLGPDAQSVLEATCPGCADHMRSTARFAGVRIGGAPCLVLREAELQYLVLVPRGQAVEVWRTLEATGMGFHMGAVGRQALDRFTVSRRTLAHQARA